MREQQRKMLAMHTRERDRRSLGEVGERGCASVRIHRGVHALCDCMRYESLVGAAFVDSFHFVLCIAPSSLFCSMRIQRLAFV